MEKLRIDSLTKLVLIAERLGMLVGLQLERVRRGRDTARLAALSRVVAQIALRDNGAGQAVATSYGDSAQLVERSLLPSER